MKLFQFFVIENFLVAGLPQRNIHEFEIAPPIAKKVSGIEMTELAFYRLVDLSPPLKKAAKEFPSRMLKSFRNGDDRLDQRCQCLGAWKNFDSNDGTGDHEEFK